MTPAFIETTRGRGVFARCYRNPGRTHRPIAFALQMPDGTRALVVAGEVRLVEISGDRPGGWQLAALEARTTGEIRGNA